MGNADSIDSFDNFKNQILKNDRKNLENELE
jgi:hypothetical protein